jgi:hypothetical protein
MADSKDSRPDSQGLTSVKKINAEADRLAAEYAKKVSKLKLEPVQYDTKDISKVLDLVFHAGVSEGEEILCYFDSVDEKHLRTSKSMHSLPKREADFLKLLPRSKKPARLHYCIASTCEEDDGRLSNKKSQFVSLRCIILDDIGTKIPIDTLPKVLADNPSYIIESSEGNYQYGYVFDEPIEDYEIAQAVVTLVSTSKYTDSGGCSITKKVRLPNGIHGKASSNNIMFRTALNEIKGTLWKPQDLLNALGYAVKWESIVNDAEHQTRIHARMDGLAAYSPMQVQVASSNGFVDEMAEFLNRAGLILSRSGTALGVECPRAHEHTDGEIMAFYFPLGSGKGVYKMQRGFHCFHDHAKNGKPTLKEYLETLTFTYPGEAPEVPMKIETADLVSTHIFDSENGLVHGMGVDTGITTYALKNFLIAFNRRVEVPGISAKGLPIVKFLTEAKVWQNSQSRITVHGARKRPATNERIIMHEGMPRLNSYDPPHFSRGTYDQKYIDTFLDFIHYLIPIKEQCDLFIMWVAAKVQDMSFRGWGMLIISEAHGTGRGTLTEILKPLFNERNVAAISTDELLGKGSSYNDWETSSLIVINELYESGTDFKTQQATYNRLRSVIDTSPQMTLIKHKYGKQFSDIVYSSYLMYSNHQNALTALDDKDRRIYVMEGAVVPREAEYFSELSDWRKDGSYAEHLYRWFTQVEVDYTLLNGRAPATAIKTNMIQHSMSAAEVLVRTYIKNVKYGIVTLGQARDLADRFFSRLNLDPNRVNRSLSRHLTNYSEKIPRGDITIRESKTVSRPRYTDLEALPDILLTASDEEISDEVMRGVREDLRKRLEDEDLDAIADKISTALDLEGF